ncbi:mannose-1-phosphate guanylyltransferase [Georgenia thermotolerans]|uniref:Mannose-1-phosphate guanylyltransferase n=1 Tax=Georgenia thermotolerans TaxID=527326 RepID=A0A7J5UQI2_9MICO|nr:mannose-1-phosphate guanylyltransferase [Georgenia thermotolerans]KAE8764639.1 mannose-1-phosphate guanylyltransferase [Georgenia thermotolerans]
MSDSLLHAIVPAGGAGTRLWPLSRRTAPKFLLDLTGAGRTLLQQTVDRLRPLTGAGGVTVVTGTAHAAAVRAQLPELAEADLLAEPSPRDSMAAIGLAAAVLARRHGDVVVGSFAADHVVRDTAAFERAVREAVAVARAGYVVTIGIEADRPSTAFGYIRAGEPLGGAGTPTARRVVGFTEKPDADTAAAYLATGEYRWNAGMFVVRAAVLLDHLAAERPALHAGLGEIADAWDTDARQEVLARVWPDLEKVAIDHAIAEPVAARGGVAVVPAAMGWDDVGDFASLATLVPPADDDVRVLGPAADVLTVDADGALVVPGSGRTVTVLGIPDAVVVDTPDAVLVTTRAHAQQVKQVVDLLRDGRDRLL